MTKLFSNQKTDGLQDQGDRLGGNEPFEQAIHDATIKVAYAGQAASGAQNVTLVADIGGREYRETLYYTNRNGENFFLQDKKDPNSAKNPLPGFTTINDICLLTTGEELSDQDTEEKVVKVYNFDERKEVPTPVQVIVALTGQKIKLGILKVKEFKQKKNDAGVYVDTQETRITNSIDKVFHAETLRTVTEYRQEVQTPEFHDAWDKRNTGKERDKTAGAKSNGASGTGRPGGLPGASGGASGNGQPKRKLFGNPAAA